MKSDVLDAKLHAAERQRTTLAAIILTKNEELHIERCLRSLNGLATEILIVDSYSTDRTVEIAEGLGAVVKQNPFKNYADQFNWALNNLGSRPDWILRIDADERLDEALRSALEALPSLPTAVTGLTVRLQDHFLGAPIRFGGRQLKLLRLFRYGVGRIEARWMDEHITLKEGQIRELKGLLLHSNNKPISEWINKHVAYSQREAIDALNLKYRFLGTKLEKTEDRMDRRLFYSLGGATAPLLLFLYRFIFRLGFLDGRAGYLYHFFQCYWYRTLVSMQIEELEHQIRNCRTNDERISIIRERTRLNV
jgi:glycosyltransferase involved in cell wall biosynthesis